MGTIKGTQTELNLLASFAGESQARNRYTYFASVAKKEGYVQISAIFEETANQEKEHAKMFFKYLEGGELSITATYPAGVIGTTAENLKEAADGEYDEWYNLYKSAAEVAEKEGFAEIAATFRNVAVAEMEHENRYRRLLSRLESGDFFKREEEQVWQCRNCGYVSTPSDTAPLQCPACKHPQAHFEPKRENY